MWTHDTWTLLSWSLIHLNNSIYCKSAPYYIDFRWIVLEYYSSILRANASSLAQIVYHSSIYLSIIVELCLILWSNRE